MAYKFQKGPATMSGTLTQEGGFRAKTDGSTDSAQISGSGDVTIEGGFIIKDTYQFTKNGVLHVASFGDDWTNAGNTVADLGSVTTCDINGGTVDGITSLVVGADGSGADVTFHSDTSGDYMMWDSSEEQLKIVGTSGQVALDIDTGNLTVGAYGLTDAGAATIASMAGNWTNAGITVADLGSVTTCDINGGAIDGAVIGASSAKEGSFLGITSSAGYGLKSLGGVFSTSLSGSTTLSANGAITFQGVAAAAAADGNAFVWIEEGLLKTETFDNLSSLLAGAGATSGLSSGNSALAINVGGLDPETSVQTGDLLLMEDVSDNGQQKITMDNFITKTPALLTEATIALADDYVMFLDGSGTGDGKKEKWADLAALMAGNGITATNGVLSTDGAGAPSNTLDGGTLSEGYNYMTGSKSSNCILPAEPTVGDVVTLKVGNLGKSDVVTVTGSRDMILIDGDSQQYIESAYAAIGFVYMVSGSWSIV